MLGSLHESRGRDAQVPLCSFRLLELGSHEYDKLPLTLVGYKRTKNVYLTERSSFNWKIGEVDRKLGTSSLSTRGYYSSFHWMVLWKLSYVSHSRWVARIFHC